MYTSINDEPNRISVAQPNSSPI